MDNSLHVMVLVHTDASNGSPAWEVIRRVRQLDMTAQGYYHLVVPIQKVTVSELEYGDRRSGRYETEIEALRKILLPFDLYDYDAVACAEQYGRIRHELDSAGGTIGALDLLIAAYALGLNATLVTNNEKHFRRVTNLAVENWTQAASDDE